EPVTSALLPSRSILIQGLLPGRRTTVAARLLPCRATVTAATVTPPAVPARACGPGPSRQRDEPEPHARRTGRAVGWSGDHPERAPRLDHHRLLHARDPRGAGPGRDDRRRRAAHPPGLDVQAGRRRRPARRLRVLALRQPDAHRARGGAR